MEFHLWFVDLDEAGSFGNWGAVCGYLVADCISRLEGDFETPGFLLYFHLWLIIYSLSSFPFCSFCFLVRSFSCWIMFFIVYLFPKFPALVFLSCLQVILLFCISCSSASWFALYSHFDFACFRFGFPWVRQSTRLEYYCSVVMILLFFCCVYLLIISWPFASLSLYGSEPVLPECDGSRCPHSEPYFRVRHIVPVLPKFVIDFFPLLLFAIWSVRDPFMLFLLVLWYSQKF